MWRKNSFVQYSREQFSLIYREGNCARALGLAEKYLNIPMIISPENLSSPDLDELSCITYLSYFMKRKSVGYNATLQRVQQVQP
jgi:filamin